MSEIRGKLRSVPDELCKACTQLWEDECRAFELPHSEEESKHRVASSSEMKCFGLRVVPRRVREENI